VTSLREFSLNTLQDLYAQETGNWPIILLTLDHENLAEPLLVSSDPTERIGEVEGKLVYGTVSRGDSYICYPFGLMLPSDEDGGSYTTQLTIDNVDQSITDAIRDLTSPSTITMELVMGQDPDTVEMTMPDFRLTNVQWDNIQVAGDISLEMFLQELIGPTYRPGSHPGLFK